MKHIHLMGVFFICIFAIACGGKTTGEWWGDAGGSDAGLSDAGVDDASEDATTHDPLDAGDDSPPCIRVVERKYLSGPLQNAVKAGATDVLALRFSISAVGCGQSVAIYGLDFMLWSPDMLSDDAVPYCKAPCSPGDWNFFNLRLQGDEGQTLMGPTDFEGVIDQVARVAFADMFTIADGKTVVISFIMDIANPLFVPISGMRFAVHPLGIHVESDVVTVAGDFPGSVFLTVE
ncbi:MAG: hypothetical protein NUV81_02140 [bacterium]|nr:hypothetical protein [bacterium]